MGVWLTGIGRWFPPRGDSESNVKKTWKGLTNILGGVKAAARGRSRALKCFRGAEKKR